MKSISFITTITVCEPGSTTNCQSIDGIEVDTGSYGLRLMASVLTLSLPAMAAANGNSLVECMQFVGGYSWGPVARVDVQVAGESASSVPVQLIGDPAFPTCRPIVRARVPRKTRSRRSAPTA
jgi:uncharacterized protein DUF3443